MIQRSTSPSGLIKSPNAISPYYLKINFTESQLKVFELKSKKLNMFFSDKGFLFNQPEFFKVLVLNFDNPDFMRVMLELYSSDCSTLFHKDIPDAV